MQGFGAALEQAIIGLMILTVIVTAIAVLALERLVVWLWQHVSIAWV